MLAQLLRDTERESDPHKWVPPSEFDSRREDRCLSNAYMMPAIALVIGLAIKFLGSAA